ncbi:MAG: hypothetical protein LUG91_05605 [Ruminococcus sp.]|nr:hypothetical protein [Ruminococcus sp.]
MKKLINELLDILRGYDFSNDICVCAKNNADFIRMTDVMEKFFVYKISISNKPKQEDYKTPIQESIDTWEEFDNKFELIDPDSNSKKLQLIYRILWDEKLLNTCEKGKRICGDTINSVANALSSLWENGPYTQYKKYITGKDELLYIDEVESLVKIYHTLGNFMPVPHNDFNRTKNWKTSDFFDDTLFCIYQWYSNKSLTECEWLNEFSGWLNAFGSWEAFVMQNFLEDFVDENLLPLDLFSTPDSNQKAPTKSLEASHGMPNKKDEFKDVKLKNFFENAAYCINKRTERMIDALHKRLDELFN